MTGTQNGSDQKLTLVYWEIAGRVEPSRLACVIGKVPFRNEVIPMAEFAERKKDLPLQQLPLLYVDTANTDRMVVGQSDAILRFLGKQSGLYPVDPVKAMQCDHYMGVMDDVFKHVMTTYSGAIRMHLSDDTDFTDEERIAVGTRAIAKDFPKYLGAMEQELADHDDGPWLLGDTLTIADLKLCHWIPWIQSGWLPAFPPSCLDDYPKIVGIVDRIKGLPEVVAFHAEHSQPYDNFDFVPEQKV